MPRSKAKRRVAAAQKVELEAQVEALTKRKTETFEKAIEITLPKVALGDIRRRWTSIQTPLHPALISKVPNFVRIASDAARPLVIYGSDGGLLVCRIRLEKPDVMQRLSDTIDQLPTLKQHDFRGVDRGPYTSRHLGIWVPLYSKRTQYTAEHREHQGAHDEFLERNNELFGEMTDFLRMMAPRTYKDYLRYPLPKGQKRAAGAWAGLVVNDGGMDAERTNVHRDVKESQYGYSCIVSCGDFTGGALILYELECVLEMETGDMVLFPDSLINHSNEEAHGHRKSIVAFTQENVFYYWRRKFNMRLRADEARERRRVGKKAGKADKEMNGGNCDS